MCRRDCPRMGPARPSFLHTRIVFMIKSAKKVRNGFPQLLSPLLAYSSPCAASCMIHLIKQYCAYTAAAAVAEVKNRSYCLSTIDTQHEKQEGYKMRVFNFRLWQKEISGARRAAGARVFMCLPRLMTLCLKLDMTRHFLAIARVTRSEHFEMAGGVFFEVIWPFMPIPISNCPRAVILFGRGVNE